jgi:hypothetical protein
MPPAKSGKQMAQEDAQEAKLEEEQLNHEQFLEANLKVKEFLTDFTATLLLHKPDDIYIFAKNFFTPYNNV